MHRIFQPSAKQPLDFEATVERTLRDLMKRLAVRGVFYDPYQMAAVAQRLQGAGVPMREFPQTTGNLTEIGSNLYELIEARGLVAYSDPDLSRRRGRDATRLAHCEGQGVAQNRRRRRAGDDGARGGTRVAGGARAEFRYPVCRRHAAQHSGQHVRMVRRNGR